MTPLPAHSREYRSFEFLDPLRGLGIWECENMSLSPRPALASLSAAEILAGVLLEGAWVVLGKVI